MITVCGAMDEEKFLVAKQFDFLHHVSSLYNSHQYLQIIRTCTLFSAVQQLTLTAT